MLRLPLSGVPEALRDQIEFSLSHSLHANAVFLAEQFRSLCPTSTDAVRLLALSHQRAGSPAKAISVLAATKATQGVLSEECALVGASCCAELGRWKDGLSFLFDTREMVVTAATHAPMGAPGLYVLGTLLRGLERTAEAGTCFERCLRLNPFMWCAFEALCNMGKMTDSLRASLFPQHLLPPQLELGAASHEQEQRKAPPPPPAITRAFSRLVASERQHQQTATQESPPLAKRKQQVVPLAAPRKPTANVRIPRPPTVSGAARKSAPFLSPGQDVQDGFQPMAVSPPEFFGARKRSPKTGSGSPPASSTSPQNGKYAALAFLGELAKVQQRMSAYECREALQQLDSLPAAQRNTGWALCLRGRAHFELTEYAEAVRAYEEARRAEPHRTEGMEYFSTALWHLRRDVDLAHLAQSLVEEDKRSPQAWCAMGNAFSLRGDHSSAVKLFARATQVDPTFAYAFSLSGHELVATDDLEKAESCFRLSVKLDERHYNGLLGIGSIYQRTENFEEAATCFRQALGIAPRNSVVRTHLAQALHALGHTSEALVEVETAIMLCPRNHFARVRRAEFLLALGRAEEARAEAESITRVVPEAAIHALLSRIYQRLGLTSAATVHASAAADAAASPTIKRVIDSLQIRRLPPEDGHDGEGEDDGEGSIPYEDGGSPSHMSGSFNDSQDI